MQLKLSLVLLTVIGLIFIPTSVFLLIGMSPTLVLMAADRTPGKNKTICVGTMNFAGCFPFLLDFWLGDSSNDIATALNIITEVQTLITIFIMAAGGYAIDMAVTGITSSLIVQRSQKRIKRITKEQKELVKRWGEKVTGKYKLDDYGFPIKPIPSEKKPSSDEKNE